MEHISCSFYSVLILFRWLYIFFILCTILKMELKKIQIKRLHKHSILFLCQSLNLEIINDSCKLNVWPFYRFVIAIDGILNWFLSNAILSLGNETTNRSIYCTERCQLNRALKISLKMKFHSHGNEIAIECWVSFYAHKNIINIIIWSVRMDVVYVNPRSLVTIRNIRFMVKFAKLKCHNDIK